MIRSLISSRSLGLPSLLRISPSTPLSRLIQASHSARNSPYRSYWLSRSLRAAFQEQSRRTSSLSVAASPQSPSTYVLCMRFRRVFHPSASGPHSQRQQQLRLSLYHPMRRLQTQLFSWLYRKRTVRLARQWTHLCKALTFATLVISVYYENKWKVERLVESYTELSKPESFYAGCEADPYRMSREEWDIVQGHYTRFHYR